MRWNAKGGHRHEFGYSGIWRQVTGLANGASPTVRNDAGDSMKSSVSHTWISDQRDSPLLPTRGYFMKSISEIAGWGPLKGDVAFWRSEVEAQTAFPIPIPGLKGRSGITFNTGLRAGLLYPLALAGQAEAQASRINDRFQLGGPTDVRGLPSLAAGIGIVYAHPVARFEMNFTLPLVIRQGEEARKGLQFGVGISFL